MNFTIHLLTFAFDMQQPVTFNVFAFDMQQPITFNISCSACKCGTKSVTLQSFSFSLFLLSIGSCVIHENQSFVIPSEV
jgi:hypothetical protein